MHFFNQLRKELNLFMGLRNGEFRGGHQPTRNKLQSELTCFRSFLFLNTFQKTCDSWYKAEYENHIGYIKYCMKQREHKRCGCPCFLSCSEDRFVGKLEILDGPVNPL